MPDSSTSSSPYDVLGVTATATVDELRRAYRKKLRETHPDTGGSAAGFDRVQRAWEQVGTPEERAAHDRGSNPREARGTRTTSSSGETTGGTSPSRPGSAAGGPSGSSFVPRQPAAPRAPSQEPARAYGHPGGWRRERFLTLMREWAGRGANLSDPYDAALVRSAPREIRHLLEDANAEEQTARTLATLGINFTIWHDVATDAGSGGPEDKLDHVLLGPTGLFAILSEDWGGPVEVKKGEIVGETLAPGERPFRALYGRAKSITRATRVKFSALVIVVPDSAIGAAFTLVGRTRGIPNILIQRSQLVTLTRDGLPGTPQVDASDLFESRDRLQRTIRFV